MYAHRTSKYIGFRAFHDSDDDILDWWEAIPNGERSHVLRTLIRAFLTGHYTTTPVSEEPVAFASSVQLAQLKADTTWIRDALSDFPAYLEQLIGNIKVMSPAPVPVAASMTGEPPNGETLSNERAQKRLHNMKQRRW